MKKYIILPVALMCAACVSVETLTQQAQEFANNLETENEPIQVIEAYNKYTDLCRWKWSNGHSKAPVKAECIRRDSMAEPGTVFKCINEPYYNSAKEKQEYESDECILYRRSKKFHESQVKYFDYKRFLGENSVIKKDEDFLKLVGHYYKITECDKLSETTEAEKEACKEQRKNEIRQLAKQRIPCMELVKDKYVEKLRDTGDWYRWAINHDPNEQVRLMRALGEYEAARWMYQPVWGRTEAREKVKERITEFGEENFCTTDNWKTEIKKLGFNL